MDAMWIDQDYSGESSCNVILDKKPYANTFRFFEYLKDFHKLLWDKYKTHSKLSFIA
jgi:hypothetical protein